jgi:hypothetical protein
MRKRAAQFEAARLGLNRLKVSKAWANLADWLRLQELDKLVVMPEYL